jgi:putative ABC transport system permease protein
VEPLLHRFAYVGADLQDLFAVRPSTVVAATRLQDAYFSGGSAQSLMARLAARPDGVLVSAETVKDFALAPGDTLRLRLRDTRSGQLREVPFHYVGVAKEFPTAPRDSFLVTNADYVTAQTGDPSVGSFLIDTGGASPPAVAARVRRVVGPTAVVSDVDSSRRVVGSSLTAVDLDGLSRVELGFALVLAVAAAGLVLAANMAQRRRAFAITTALGARPRQLGAFVRTEAAVVAVLGLSAGAVVAAVIAAMLVKVLTGVFDPPPASLAVPFAYLGGLGILALAAATMASEATVRAARRPAPGALRES